MAPMHPDSTLQKLFVRHSKCGFVKWIGLRPQRRADLLPVDKVIAVSDKGLDGDHFSGSPGSKRQVTLIQAEHLNAVASILGLDEVNPGLLRRNLVVEGINLLALKDQRFRVGEALLEYSGLCHPCSRMEENLGPGGYNAVRGHGGIIARVVESGSIGVGDTVRMIPATELEESEQEQRKPIVPVQKE